jgi:phosphoribosylanthranilate isomerase
MLIKVCGMKNPTQIKDLANSGLIDMLGFIFYPPSKRAIHDVPECSTSCKRVGVFVNEELDKVLQIADQNNLDIIQLHGTESAAYCKKIQRYFPIIKAIGIDSDIDFSTLKAYEKSVSHFLFDTRTSKYGGSGEQFDWNLVNKYTLDTPFLLSGGISAQSIDAVLKIEHPHFCGIDLNSRFEIEPGIKNIELVKSFITTLKSKL